jgi:hypothetical protein
MGRVEARAGAFEAARVAYTLYGWLLQEMAKEVGWEKTVEINASVGDRLGGMIGGMLRDKCADREVNAASVASILEEGLRDFGLDYEVEAHGDGATARYSRCPLYQGLSDSGIDHATIERVCSGIASRQGAQVHSLFPALTVKIKIREKADDLCVEEYALTK